MSRVPKADALGHVQEGRRIRVAASPISYFGARSLLLSRMVRASPVPNLWQNCGKWDIRVPEVTDLPPSPPPRVVAKANNGYNCSLEPMEVISPQVLANKRLAATARNPANERFGLLAYASG
jgi:hypothetical protein